MSSSEKNYLLRTSPPSGGLKVILNSVAIGALVGGMLLALALSLTALATNQKDYDSSTNTYGSSTRYNFIKMSSDPLSAKVLYGNIILFPYMV